MSGGSYNYLYAADVDQLFEFHRLNDLEGVRDRLRSLGHIDAAGQTDAVISTIKEAVDLVCMRQGMLSGVWKAVEMLDSNDWGEGAVSEAVAEYRKKTSRGEPIGPCQRR